MVVEIFGFSGPPIGIQLFGGLIFVIVIGAFIFAIIKGLNTWTANNASEILIKPCKVVSKRTKVWGGSGDSSAHTNYFITFEFEDKTRLELHVGAKHYGMIAENDFGELTYQGTRFKDFNRYLD